MIKKLSDYFVIPVAICAFIFLALKPQNSLNVDDYSTEGLELNYDIAFNNTNNYPSHLPSSNGYFPDLGNSYISFKEALAFKESRGDYFTVNTLGYLGKYQFGTR